MSHAELLNPQTLTFDSELAAALRRGLISTTRLVSRSGCLLFRLYEAAHIVHVRRVGIHQISNGRYSSRP